MNEAITHPRRPTLERAALLLAVIVVAVRFASPYLHNHSCIESHSTHEVVQANGCASCDEDATFALIDAAPAPLPEAPFYYSLLITSEPVSENQSLALRLTVGRAPPSEIA